MESGQEVRIVIVGTGLIGPRHARSVSGCSGARLVCLVDPRAETQAVADEFQVPLYSSVEHMLQHSEYPDAAIVCTPNHTHVSISIALLKAGIHVLVEKPISTGIASGRELLQVANESGKHLLVGHHRRFNPYVLAAKRSLPSIGRPIAVSGHWVTFKPPSYFEAPFSWRASAEQGGGPILINLIHDVDILQYLLGPIVRVHAEKSITQREGHAVEEGAAILLRFASGVVGTFILSDALPSTHTFESATGENPMIAQHVGSDFYRIFGSEGTLSVGDMRLERYSGEKSWSSQMTIEDVQVGDEVPFDHQVRNLVAVVRGSEKAMCTGEDGLSALLVCDAVKRAMESGQAVEIEPHSGIK